MTIASCQFESMAWNEINGHSDLTDDLRATRKKVVMRSLMLLPPWVFPEAVNVTR
jgi:hypothetical protein